jgi:transposase
MVLFFMRDYRLTLSQISSLKYLHRTLRDRKLADRVKAVILLGRGWSVSEVAEVLLLDENSVRHYFERYFVGGEAELLVLNYQGRQSTLTIEQEKILSEHLDKNVYLSSGAVRHYIDKTFGVLYRPSGVKALLHRLGFVYKKPKHVPSKLDPQAQKEFVAMYEQLKENKGKNDPIYFGDAVHPQHNSIPSYGWIRRGVDKELRSNGGRRRVNINGVLNIESLEIATDFAKTIDAHSTLRLLRRLEKKHPEADVVHVILDNAAYNKSKWLGEKLEGSKIELHYLPDYSPNLNVIERLWKFFKKKILYNKYYEKFDDFVAVCKGFFRNRKKYQDELRSLLTDNFQIFNKKNKI